MWICNCPCNVKDIWLHMLWKIFVAFWLWLPNFNWIPRCMELSWGQCNIVLYNSHNITHYVEAMWMKTINEMKGWNFKYFTSKIPPLFNLEMLKGQPMIELFKVITWCCIRWMPLRPYDFKICICFNKCFGILLVFANFHMFCS